MPSDRVIKTQLLIIGGGIAGYSLAYEASRNGIESVVLDDFRQGTTHSATGILDARPDHLPRDIDSVAKTAEEIVEWQNNFPYGTKIIKPTRFIMPISPDTPYNILSFDALFEFYAKVAEPRFQGLPDRHRIVDASYLEGMEPNLRKNYFDSAFLFWLWTVDPDALLQKVRNEVIMFSGLAKRVITKKIIRFVVDEYFIKEVHVDDYKQGELRITGYRPLIVVNATGPWIGETLKELGIKFPVELKLGVQAKFMGRYFQSDSGIMTFGRDKKYVICLQKDDYLQVGPTNGHFSGRLPKKIEGAGRELNYLQETLSNVLESNHLVSNPELLKYGWRVKSQYFFDTDRSVIWHHQKEGFSNLYTAVPGKMALGLLMARGLLSRLYRNGQLEKNTKIYLEHSLSLNGRRRFFNQVKLAWLYVKSHFTLAIHFARYRIKRLLSN